MILRNGSGRYMRHPHVAFNIACPTLRPSNRPAIQLARSRSLAFSQTCHVRSNLHNDPTTFNFLNEFKNSYRETSQSDIGSISKIPEGTIVRVSGFIGKKRKLSEARTFANLYRDGEEIQVVSRRDHEQNKDHDLFNSVKPHSAVAITGIIAHKRVKNRSMTKQADLSDQVAKEIVLQTLTPLASFPNDILISDQVQFGPHQRHLQIRFDEDLRRNLRFRSQVLRGCRECLGDFQEIETPILFKSTPEGAREFLVPTRKLGYAYALPQSPQQYKQILMGSGINKYFQIAKCFRDEDLRADRQPEFSQLDLEMAFATGEDVMRRMEKFIKSLHEFLRQKEHVTTDFTTLIPEIPLPRMTYDEAMAKHGIDKPDLRIKDLILRAEHIMTPELKSMLTSLPDPIVESYRIRLKCEPAGVRAFVTEFMDSPEAASFLQNPDGPPGIFVYDPRKPLEGLQAFGFEGMESLKELYSAGQSKEKRNDSTSETYARESHTADADPFQEGDLIIVQARPRRPLSGGSTALGRLRSEINKAAAAQGLIDIDLSHKWLWITDFPLFTPTTASDPGQGGRAGFSATHHPFTAPKTIEDIDLLFTDPLKAKADHYDLVMNGVELGGGSRRIHNSEMQQFVMRQVLMMSEERTNDFSHLFEVLRAGCPPHAGIALGLDRLVAILLGRESVRDVIAFPKGGKGEDMLVKSPSKLTNNQLRTYHFKERN